MINECIVEGMGYQPDGMEISGLSENGDIEALALYADKVSYESKARLALQLNNVVAKRLTGNHSQTFVSISNAKCVAFSYILDPSS